MSKKSKNKNLNFRVVSQGGIPCPRCYVPTELRERTQVTDKQLSQPYYFSRWYNCNNDECPTTLIMREEFKIHERSQSSSESPAPRGDSHAAGRADGRGTAALGPGAAPQRAAAVGRIIT